MADIKIRCPKCDWQPMQYSRWQCSCKHLWNTFDTAGRCPQCSKIWKDTQCLECHCWNPHLDWYDGLDEAINKLKQEIKEAWELAG
ncbi:hypothetical protein [Mucilaginibacter sp.]